MDVCCTDIDDVVLSGQEKRIQGLSENILRAERPRVWKIVSRFDGAIPSLDAERALFFTRSMKQTEGQPLPLRWAKALMHIAENISVHIDDDQLIVGRIGCVGRYGAMYPEVEGDFYREFLAGLSQRESSCARISEENMACIMEEIAPYWEGKTFHEALNASLPKEIHTILFDNPQGTQQRFIVTESASWRSALQWVHDYDRVIRRGFLDIRREAEEKLASLDPCNPIVYTEKKPFLEAIMLVCDAIVLWARRHAERARQLAAQEQNPVRRAELLVIADNCQQVPACPAQTFHQAVQAQWFTQLFSRLEQRTGTTISNGRMDQYLFPLYKKDKDAGRIDDRQTLELLECLFACMAQYTELYVTSQGMASNQGYAHWEAVTIGGQTREGLDATNDLSYLFLKSKREFPLHYPDLAARVHLRSPQRFLWEVAETIKYGSGYPKLMNDEEIVPSLVNKGAELAEAFDYAVSGCTEVRMPNRDTYTSGCPSLNMGALVELTLYNGRMKKFGDTLLGVETGDPRTFATWEEFWQAHQKQLTHLLTISMATMAIINKTRPRHFAQPMGSALHDLCMKHCVDLHAEHIPEGLDLALIDLKCYPSGVDALSAVKFNVYDKKRLTMDQLITALEANFEGYEDIQAMLFDSPCYGNNDPYADSIGKAIERHCCEFAWQYMQELGIWVDIRYVPITAHVPMGRVVSALPNGRKAWTPLADGTSASHGADVNGPTGVLLSNDATKNKDYKNRAARMLNLKFSPKALEGKEGTRKLISFIRSFIELKLWHMQINVINHSTLRAAQKDPQKYRSLIVRVAGYSAYFVDLSPDLQTDIIERTEHSSL